MSKHHWLSSPEGGRRRHLVGLILRWYAIVLQSSFYIRYPWLHECELEEHDRQEDEEQQGGRIEQDNNNLTSTKTKGQTSYSQAPFWTGGASTLATFFSSRSRTPSDSGRVLEILVSTFHPNKNAALATGTINSIDNSYSPILQANKNNHHNHFQHQSSSSSLNLIHNNNSNNNNNNNNDNKQQQVMVKGGITIPNQIEMEMEMEEPLPRELLQNDWPKLYTSRRFYRLFQMYYWYVGIKLSIMTILVIIEYYCLERKNLFAPTMGSAFLAIRSAANIGSVGSSNQANHGSTEINSQQQQQQILTTDVPNVLRSTTNLAQSSTNSNTNSNLELNSTGLSKMRASAMYLLCGLFGDFLRQMGPGRIMLYGFWAVAAFITGLLLNYLLKRNRCPMYSLEFVYNPRRVNKQDHDTICHLLLDTTTLQSLEQHLHHHIQQPMEMSNDNHASLTGANVGGVRSRQNDEIERSGDCLKLERSMELPLVEEKPYAESHSDGLRRRRSSCHSISPTNSPTTLKSASKPSGSYNHHYHNQNQDQNHNHHHHYHHGDFHHHNHHNHHHHHNHHYHHYHPHHHHHHHNNHNPYDQHHDRFIRCTCRSMLSAGKRYKRIITQYVTTNNKLARLNNWISSTSNNSIEPEGGSNFANLDSKDKGRFFVPNGEWKLPQIRGVSRLATSMETQLKQMEIVQRLRDNSHHRKELLSELQVNITIQDLVDFRPYIRTNDWLDEMRTKKAQLFIVNSLTLMGLLLPAIYYLIWVQFWRKSHSITWWSWLLDVWLIMELSPFFVLYVGSILVCWFTEIVSDWIHLITWCDQLHQQMEICIYLLQQFRALQQRKAYHRSLSSSKHINVYGKEDDDDDYDHYDENDDDNDYENDNENENDNDEGEDDDEEDYDEDDAEEEEKEKEKDKEKIGFFSTFTGFFIWRPRTQCCSTSNLTISDDHSNRNLVVAASVATSIGANNHRAHPRKDEEWNQERDDNRMAYLFYQAAKCERFRRLIVRCQPSLIDGASLNDYYKLTRGWGESAPLNADGGAGDGQLNGGWRHFVGNHEGSPSTQSCASSSSKHRIGQKQVADKTRSLVNSNWSWNSSNFWSVSLASVKVIRDFSAHECYLKKFLLSDYTFKDLVRVIMGHKSGLESSLSSSPASQDHHHQQQQTDQQQQQQQQQSTNRDSETMINELQQVQVVAAHANGSSFSGDGIGQHSRGEFKLRNGGNVFRESLQLISDGQQGGETADEHLMKLIDKLSDLIWVNMFLFTGGCEQSSRFVNLATNMGILISFLATLITLYALRLMTVMSKSNYDGLFILITMSMLFTCNYVFLISATMRSLCKRLYPRICSMIALDDNIARKRLWRNQLDNWFCPKFRLAYKCLNEIITYESVMKLNAWVLSALLLTLQY